MNYSIYVESTPNPEVMKFVSNQIITEKNIEILEKKDAQENMIAMELFKFPFIKSIFLSKNFISITKDSSIQWEDIAMQLRVFILDFLNKDYAKKTIIKKPDQKIQERKKVLNKKKFNEDERKIDHLLKEYIQPAVETDGGFITLDSFSNGTVFVNLKGACSGCPSSTITLKQGIESLLKEKLGEKIKEVVATNT